MHCNCHPNCKCLMGACRCVRDACRCPSRRSTRRKSASRSPRRYSRSVSRSPRRHRRRSVSRSPRRHRRRSVSRSPRRHRRRSVSRSPRRHRRRSVSRSSHRRRSASRSPRRHRRRSASHAPRRHVIYRDNVLGLKDPQFKRIALSVGITRLSGDSYKELRLYSKYMLENLVSQAVIYTDNSNRKTINFEDIKYAFKNITGHDIYASGKSDPCKIYKGKKGNASQETYLTRQFNFYSKQHDCVYFDKLPIERLLREVTQDFGQYMWSAEAKELTQLVLEKYLQQLLVKAKMLTQQADRTTVSAKDIRMALHFCGPTHIKNV